MDYDQKSCRQSKSVLLSLRILMTTAPFVLICIAQLILMCYPISEMQRKANNAEIKRLYEEEQEEHKNQETDFLESTNSVARIIENSGIFSRYKSID